MKSALKTILKVAERNCRERRQQEGWVTKRSEYRFKIGSVHA